MSEHEQWDIVSGIGITALGVAATRAVESGRPDRLIDDPYATAFVNAVGAVLPMIPQWTDDDAGISDPQAILLRGSNYTGVRSRFFDDYLRAACVPPIEQSVILAAGLDARAFRLDLPPGLRLFELDQPKVLEFKDAVLTGQGALPRCVRQTVAIDLREDWPDALRAAGFDATVPTAWLAEGLLPYLDGDAEHLLFDRIAQLSAIGSQVSVERPVDLPGLMGRGGLSTVRDEGTGLDMTDLVQAEPRPDPATWLAEHGWRVTSEPASAVAARYHRDLHDPRLDSLPGTPMPFGDYTAFLTARRVD